MDDQLETTEARAWLLQSRFNPFPIVGTLSLARGRLSFTLIELAAEESLDWLERELESDQLADRIRTGEKIVAFDMPLSECEVSWPITGGGAMMLVRTQKRRWVVSYDYPSGGAVSNTLSMLSGRGKAKVWKRALAAAEAAAADKAEPAGT